MGAQGLTFKDLRNAILFAAFIYLVVVFINDIVDVLLVLSITALLVVSLDPFVTWLEKHKIPRSAGTAIVILTLLGTIAGLTYLIAPVAGRQLSELAADFPDLLEKIRRWFAYYSEHFPTFAKLAPKLNVGTLLQFIKPFIGGISRATGSGILAIAAAVVILVTTIYSLINPKPLVDGFLSILDDEGKTRATAACRLLAIQIRAWARGTLFAMFVIFALTWFALTVLGFKQALLFAVIAGILEIVPVIGPILSAVPPILVALVINPVLVLWVIGSFILIQQFENHVLIPLVMSRQVQLHPVTVIFWVLVMGALFGLIGIFIATPTAVMAGILYDELYLCEYRGICRESSEINTENEENTQE
ncbi:AI-2E family transporter [bacterium]|nr:AI-2E family transporter [bacterium]